MQHQQQYYAQSLMRAVRELLIGQRDLVSESATY
jgi:hypothetical protein